MQLPEQKSPLDLTWTFKEWILCSFILICYFWVIVFAPPQHRRYVFLSVHSWQAELKIQSRAQRSNHVLRWYNPAQAITQLFSANPHMKPPLMNNKQGSFYYYFWSFKRIHFYLISSLSFFKNRQQSLIITVAGSCCSFLLSLIIDQKKKNVSTACPWKKKKALTQWQSFQSLALIL